MLIVFNCAGCDSKLEIEADRVGSRVACPTCGASIVVPRRGLEAGTTIGGFKIVRLLGRGGMGEVYLARQISMDRLVALKILPHALSSQPEAVARFIQEVRLTARLEHPNLVTAYEAGEDTGHLYLAMALVNGPTLHERVRLRGAMAEREALVILRKLADALAYAWGEHKLLHRDIKPSNVLLDPRGEPRLADLGLAKSLKNREARTLTGHVLGTPNYISPEQAADSTRVDHRSDIYSLGATFYTMVTARIPYEGRTMAETLQRQAGESLPDPRTFNPALSPACVALMEHMLARAPKGRPKTWEALIREIDCVLAGGMPGAPAEETEEGGDDEPPFRVNLIVAGGWIVATVLATTAGWMWYQRVFSVPRPSTPATNAAPAAVSGKGATNRPAAAAPRTNAPPARVLVPPPKAPREARNPKLETQRK